MGSSEIRDGVTVIRRPTVADCDAMRALFAVTWHHTYDDLLGREAVERYVAGYFSHNQLLLHIEHASMLNPIYVACIGDAIVGIITMRHTLMFSGVLDMLYVHPDFQRRGIGCKLLEKALADGYSRLVYLEVLPGNVSAIDAYERMRFQRRGLRASLSDPQQMILVMSKRLKPSPLQFLFGQKTG